MPVIPGLTITIAAGTSFFRITDVSFRTARTGFFKNAIPDVFDLSPANAPAMQVFPSLILNPSQDYNHLKDARAAIEHHGYSGLRAPSSRVKSGGNMVVLFKDQSGNVQSMTPYTIEFRLITAGPSAVPFSNHATHVVDFNAGEFKLTGNPLGIATYANWHRIEFHH